MALNDFLKKAKETAASAAESAKKAADDAKAKYDAQKQEAAAKKAEQERIRAEKQAEADGKTQKIIDEINSASGNVFDFDKKELLTFTADFYDKLYLPAHSVSASKMIFHPLDKKIIKYAQKDFENFNADTESPVFMILGKAQQRVFLSTDKLYFKKAYGTEGGFFSIGSIEINKIESLEYIYDGGNYIFKCNGVELLNTTDGLELDINSFAEYFKRIKNKDFVITDQQINDLIIEKIGQNVLSIVREYAFEDELLLYFAWGCDSLTAKDFVVCTDKQLVTLNREAFGLTKNVKQFYYEDVTSMATLQETNGLLDLALTAALSICDLEISVAGAKERLSNLFTYEAEKAVKVYRECKRSIKEANRQPVIVQAAAPQPAAADPLEQLEKLNKLKDAGIISEDEFNAKKADILSKL
ncbi:MAG: SHOCT domain-containing protein [Clostridia bacterium]|nr:SHOCT domain-containing protein [Clostridia bacterium]